MKSVLITGGSGFFGTACTRFLLQRGIGPSRIVVYSRSEHRHAEMARELKRLDPEGRLRLFIGDVRDRDRLRRAMEGIDVVIHAAALKRIETGFFDPLEVAKTNIGGTINVIEAAMDAGVRKVIGLSTDKAYHPVSPYGTSKAFAESLFLSANNMRGARGAHFAVCRYGNIWNSNGSVVPTWRKMISDQLGDELAQATVPVTDPECTRFYMTIGEAVTLVLDTVQTMKGGEIVIPTLPAYRLGDLAEAMGAKMQITGLPAWEKRAESMGPGNSSDKARRMTVQELQEALQC